MDVLTERDWGTLISASNAFHPGVRVMSQTGAGGVWEWGDVCG
jgi:hypothetical protein